MTFCHIRPDPWEGQEHTLAELLPCIQLISFISSKKIGIIKPPT